MGTTQISNASHLKMVAATYIAFAVVSALIFSASVSLNSLVCLVFYKNKQFRNPRNIFVISVAASDLLCSVTTLPLYFFANVYGRWVYGDIGCKTTAFIACLSGLTSLMQLAAASYERYVALVYPLTRRKTFTVRHASRISSVMWLYALFWSVMPLCGWSGFELEGVGASCSVRWKSHDKLDLSYNVCLILACFVFPVSVMSFSYFKCCKEIMSGAKNARDIWGKSSSFTRKAFETERRILLLFGVMTVAYLGAWTPYAVVSLISMIAGPDIVSDVTASIPAYLAKSSACYNPIIYVFLYKKFRREIYFIVRRKSKSTNRLSNGRRMSSRSSCKRQEHRSGEDNKPIKVPVSPGRAETSPC